MIRKDILRTGEISRLLGVNVRTTLGWIERGDLRAYQLPGRGDNRVLRGDLLEFLSRHRMPAPEELRRDAPRVLILGRDSQAAGRLAGSLRSSGLDVEITGSLFQAGVRLESFRPDLVVLDLRKAGLDGMDILQVIRSREECRPTKVLAVATASGRERARWLNAGADALLRTPIRRREVVEAIKKALGIAAEEPRVLEPERTSPVLGDRRLLLVGSEEEIPRETSSAQISRDPADPLLVECSRTVTEAIRKLAEGRYDAVVCWVEEQEDLTGIIRIRKAGPRIPILAVTSRKEPSFLSLASQMGADRVLRKRGRLSAVLETVRLAIRNGELSAELRFEAREASRNARDLRRLSERTRTLANQAAARGRSRAGILGGSGSSMDPAPVL